MACPPPSAKPGLTCWAALDRLASATHRLIAPASSLGTGTPAFQDHRLEVSQLGRRRQLTARPPPHCFLSPRPALQCRHLGAGGQGGA
jgi:hypothetical protein